MGGEKATEFQNVGGAKKKKKKRKTLTILYSYKPYVMLLFPHRWDAVI